MASFNLPASLFPFDAVWLVDTEFHQPAGERPQPYCLVGREIISGQVVRWWRDPAAVQAGSPPPPPIHFDERTLLVAYFAPAELGCFLELGWPMPPRILDLYAEFRCLTSGIATQREHGLLAALKYFGLQSELDALEKEDLRALAIRGGPFTADEQVALLDYCQSDADALGPLLTAMLPKIDWDCALLRGRYTVAVARMERVGIPVDAALLAQLPARRTALQQHLIAEIDREFGVYEGTSFRADRFGRWLAGHQVSWPRLPSGALDLKDETFKEMALRNPSLQPLRQLRKTLTQLNQEALPVGLDGRHRPRILPFASKTGRNQPRQSLFGAPAWMRSFIRPTPGKALAYLDYEQQEFGIAAALADDGAMKQAYESGDPYLAFGILAGGLPAQATKASHPRERELYKTCALGVQYGIGPERLGLQLGIAKVAAEQLLALHRQVFRAYWKWSDGVQDHAMFRLYLETAFGWKVHVGPETSARSLRNFPLQGNGADMLRIACCLATERGVTVCAPVHDALLIEAPADQIEQTVAVCAAAMREASELVLAGFPLRTEAKIVRSPDRFQDGRGTHLWELMTAFLGGCGGDGDLPVCPEREPVAPVLGSDSYLSAARTDGFSPLYPV